MMHFRRISNRIRFSRYYCGVEYKCTMIKKSGVWGVWVGFVLPYSFVWIFLWNAFLFFLTRWSSSTLVLRIRTPNDNTVFNIINRYVVSKTDNPISTSTKTAGPIREIYIIRMFFNPYFYVISLETIGIYCYSGPTRSCILCVFGSNFEGVSFHGGCWLISGGRRETRLAKRNFYRRYTRRIDGFGTEVRCCL